MSGLNYNTAEFAAAFGTASQLNAGELPEIVFAGRSNVGKSSLLNKIFNRKSLARVSSEPGKTATINFYRVDSVHFVDLPGYGFAKKSMGEKRRWADLLEGYFQGGRNVRLVVQLIDMRHSPSKDDIIMLNYLMEMGYPFAVVLTKCDKLKVGERAKQRESLHKELEFIGEQKIIEISSVSGEGIDVLKAAIDDALTYNNSENFA